jgi:hypothetical protein
VAQLFSLGIIHTLYENTSHTHHGCQLDSRWLCISNQNREHPSFTSDGTTPAADLLVISETYGSGTNYSDVTYRVNDLLRQPGAEFFARPEWLSADPTPGWNKALVIVYEVKGHRHTFTSGEGGRVSASLLLDTDK